MPMADMYREMIEHSPLGWAVIQEGRVLYGNKALRAICGFTVRELRGMTAAALADRFHPDDRERLQDLLARRIRGERSAAAQQFRFLHKDGSYRAVESSAVRATVNGAPAVMVSYMDITHRGQVESAYRTLVENSLVGLAIWQEGRIVFCNEMLGIISGYSCEEACAMSAAQIDAMVHPEDREPAWRGVEELLARGGAAPRQTVRLLCKRGEIRTVEVLAVATEFETRPAIQISLLDVTDRYRAGRELTETQSKLRNLAVYLLSAREEERKKVAREIHDEIGQVLTALKMDARWLEKRGELAGSKLQQKASGMVDLASQAIETVHRISSELRPGMLDDLGLGAALEWLVSEFTRRTGISCRADVSFTESRIGGNAATDIFRIAQEAFTNISRHARASSASLSVREAGDTLAIEIGDNGVGITDAQSAAPSSFGLIGIRERVNALGGETTIGANGPRGTALRVHIPLPHSGGLA